MRSDEVRRGRRRQFSAEDRRALVAAWRRSGVSQSEFARRRGIEASYLSRWKREFPESDAADTPALLPVRCVDAGAPADPSPRPFELRLPSGIEVAVPSVFDRSALTLLLDTLGVPRC